MQVQKNKIVTECFELTKLLGKWNPKGGPQHRALLTCFAEIHPNWKSWKGSLDTKDKVDLC